MNTLLVILMCLFCNPRIVIIGSLHTVEPIGIYLISIHLISLFRDFEKAFNLVDCPKECLCIVSLAYTRMCFLKMFSSLHSARLQFTSRILMVCIGFRVLLVLFSFMDN